MPGDIGTEATQAEIDLIRKSEAAADLEKKPDAKPEEKPEEETASEHEATIKAIEDKVLLGQELTEDEQKQLDELDKIIKEEKEEETAVVFRIAGKQVTFADAEKQYRESHDMVGIELKPEALKKNVETWVRAQNRSEFAIATDERSKKVAQATDSVIAQQKVLLAKEKAFALQTTKVESKLESIKTELNQTVARKAKLNAIIAARPAENEMYDGSGNPVLSKITAASRADSAKMDLEELEERETQLRSLETESLNLQKSANAELARIEAEQFILNHPQYSPTSGDFLVVYTKYAKNEELSKEDWERMYEFDTLWEEATTRKLPIENIFEFKKRNKQLAITDAQSSAAALPAPQSKTEKALQQVQRLRQRIEKAPARSLQTRGSEANRTKVTREQAARDLLTKEREVVGEKAGSDTTFDGVIKTPQSRTSS